MLTAGQLCTLRGLLSVKRVVAIALTVILSACASPVPPIVSPTAGNIVTSSASAMPTSQASPTVPTSTSQPQATSTLAPALAATEAAVEGSLIIPVTGLTTAPSENANLNISDPAANQHPSTGGESDKFQNFEIPVTGETGVFLIPITGYPPGVITRQRLDLEASYDLTNLMLEIPSLAINIPVMGIGFLDGTWDVSWLWDQAGWLEGTAYPTWNGNSVITAHVVTADGKNGPFAHLKALGIGEYIFVYNSGYRYIYQVIAKDWVKPDDTSVFSHEVDSKLTLITCDSYDEATGTYLLRVVVRAKLVEIQK